MEHRDMFRQYCIAIAITLTLTTSWRTSAAFQTTATRKRPRGQLYSFWNENDRYNNNNNNNNNRWSDNSRYERSDYNERRSDTVWDRNVNNNGYNSNNNNNGRYGDDYDRYDDNGRYSNGYYDDRNGYNNGRYDSSYPPHRGATGNLRLYRPSSDAWNPSSRYRRDHSSYNNYYDVGRYGNDYGSWNRHPENNRFYNNNNNNNGWRRDGMSSFRDPPMMRNAGPWNNGFNNNYYNDNDPWGPWNQSRRNNSNRRYSNRRYDRYDNSSDNRRSSQRYQNNYSRRRRNSSSRKGRKGMRIPKSFWDLDSDNVRPVEVQGGTLKTFAFPSPAVERVQVALKNDGEPLIGEVELWQGRDSAPLRVKVFVEDGKARPFSAVFETPRGDNAIAVRNPGRPETPFDAFVLPDAEDEFGNCEHGLKTTIRSLYDRTLPKLVEGGESKSFTFDFSVESVQILVMNEGYPMKARIELVQTQTTGNLFNNSNQKSKQVIEVVAEDGNERPFYAVIETPGKQNVVRVVNTGPARFPLKVRVEKYLQQSDLLGLESVEFMRDLMSYFVKGLLPDNSR